MVELRSLSTVQKGSIGSPRNSRPVGSPILSASASPRARPPLYPRTLVGRNTLPGSSPRNSLSAVIPEPSNTDRQSRSRPQLPIGKPGAHLAPAKFTTAALSMDPSLHRKVEPWYFLFLRCGGLALLLLLSAFMACMLHAVSTQSLNSWVVSEGSVPLASCGSQTFLVGEHVNLGAPYCVASLRFNRWEDFKQSSDRSLLLLNSVIQEENPEPELQCSVAEQYDEASGCSPDRPCVVRCFAQVPCEEVLRPASSEAVFDQTSRKMVSKENYCWPEGLPSEAWGGYAKSKDPWCSYRGTLEGGQLLQLREDLYYRVYGPELHVSPYCDKKQTLTPASVLNMRALFLFVFLQVFFFLLAELLIRWNESRKAAKKEKHQEEMSALLPSLAAEMRNSVEIEWGPQSGETSSRSVVSPVNSNGPQFETGSVLDLSPRSRRKRRKSSSERLVDPRTRFAASSWRYRLRLMAGLKEKRKALLRTRRSQHSVFLTFGFALLLSSLMVTCLVIAPEKYVEGTARSIGALLYAPSLLGTSSFAWVDAMALLDMVLEVVVLASSALLFAWPRISEKGRELLFHRRHANSKSFDREVTLACSELSPYLLKKGGGTPEKTMLSKEVCLLIPAHNSCLTPERAERFERTIRRALTMLPPSSIFVIDNNDSLHPTDSTCQKVKDINPDIHYVYLPEADRSIAVYWTNKVWIPFLHRNKLCALFRFAIVMDDDCLLPLDLDLSDLLREGGEVKAVHIPTRASSAGLLSSLQNVDLLHEALVRCTESEVGSALHLSKGIAVWDRQALDHALYESGCDHSTEHISGGLLLHKKREQAVIKSTFSAAEVRGSEDVPAWVQKEIVENDLSKLQWQYLRELLWAPSFLHKQSLMLKPSLLLLKVLPSFVETIRPLILASLLLRDPAGILALVLLSLLLSFLQQLLMMTMVRKRVDLRRGWASAFLLFPLYKLASVCLRSLTAAHEILGQSSSLDEKKLRIGIRADDTRDFPPCPPFPFVDWFTVWDPELCGPKGEAEGSEDEE